jgi:hypothetical protein
VLSNTYHEYRAMKGVPIMRKNILALLALAIVATQLGGCVVYDRPYHPYHYYYYR